MKKASHERTSTNADFQANGDEESETENASIINVPILSQEIISTDDVDTGIAIEHINAEELSGPTVPDEQKSLVCSFTKKFKIKPIIHFEINCRVSFYMYFFYLPGVGILAGERLTADR